MSSFTIGTKPITPSQNVIKKQKKAEKRAKEKKEGELYKRRKESEALLFGSELLEPIVKKEKEIIIQFPEICTEEGIYISKCGKFGYRKASSDFYFDLFYFTMPILEFELSIVIIPSEEIWLFDNITPDELEDLACRLKRAEYADEKKKALEEIKQVERERREELDRVDAEFEAEQEKEAEQLELQIAIDYSNEPPKMETLPFAPTKEEIEKAEQVIKEITKEIKPAFVPLTFKKVDKL